jgi:ATP-dependent helicase/nuclease subunit A
VIRGTVDLLLELDHGLVILDHKTFPGDRAAAEAKARSFAGQLGAYAWALTKATGKPVLSKHVHMPMVGVVVEIRA